VRGINYVTKHLNGDATSSADEEQDEEGDVEDEEVIDEDDGNKSLNSPQSPAVKGTTTSSTIKKRGETVSVTCMCNNTQCSPDDTSVLYLVQFSRVVTTGEVKSHCTLNYQLAIDNIHL